jgi:phage replication O-like protein O
VPDNQTSKEFRGFRRPTTTPIPDEVFDDLLADLTGSELKVLLYICRRTFGFKKDSDSFSLSQMINGIVAKDGKVLDRGTGLSRDSVARGVKSLVAKNIILRIRGRSIRRADEPTTY